ncbi:unnamed protein product, partial [Symbiodinium sp. KB8]
LVRYLMMARTKVKDSQIDGELVYAYAKTERLAGAVNWKQASNDSEAGNPVVAEGWTVVDGMVRDEKSERQLAQGQEHLGCKSSSATVPLTFHTSIRLEPIFYVVQANIQSVGDRLYDEKFYKAAKILYASIPNNGHVQLGEYTQAVEAAKKANNPKTWQVNLACVKVQRLQGSTSSPGAEEVEFEVHPDHLEEVIAQYEKLAAEQGCFDAGDRALMQLLETGLGNERVELISCQCD